MKKTAKKILSAALLLAILFTAFVPSLARASDGKWEALWEKEGENGVILFPGSDGSEINASWYSAEKSEPKILIGENRSLNGARTFVGRCIETNDGDFANKVTITGLEAGGTYYYRCVSEGFESATYVFKTDEDPDEFSAIYVTDVHVTDGDDDGTELKKTAELFNSTMTEATLKNPGVSLVLSAGDQASNGTEKEFKAFSSALCCKSIPVATAIGNHERKGIDYTTFKNVPNEREKNLSSSYIGSDYWFVKGGVLFLVTDSNSGSGIDHAAFMREAIKANPGVRWKILMCHHDLYGGRIPHRENECRLLRALWAPLADEFKIDLVLLGHSHYYTVSNVMFNNKTVEPYKRVMKDPKGSVYMVSGSINRPRLNEDPPLGPNVARDEITDRPIYNVLDFTKDSITVSSYKTGENDAFNSFQIVKTSPDGARKGRSATPVLNAFLRTLGTVYAFFNNVGVYWDLKEAGYDVGFFESVF